MYNRQITLIQWEAETLNNNEVLKCLRETDPTEEMYVNLFDSWREGEEFGFVSRNMSYLQCGWHM